MTNHDNQPPTRTDAPQLDPWQRPDGFPTDEYFAAVNAAIHDRGITIEGSWRDEDWEYNIELDPEGYADGPLSYYQHGVYISWRCDEMNEPKHADDFTGIGWYWVPFSKEDTALGDFSESLNLAYLAEPGEVAAAVARLVNGNESREVSQ